jgi:hypothetical protein
LKSYDTNKVAKLKTSGSSSASPGGKEIGALKKQIETLVRKRASSKEKQVLKCLFATGGRKSRFV